MFQQSTYRKMALAVAATLFTGTFAMASDEHSFSPYLGASHKMQENTLTQRAPGVPRLGPHATERLLYWTNIAMDANALDATPNGEGIPVHTPGQQAGPTRSTRAMAIVTVAMFEAVNTVMGGYQSYVGYLGAPKKTSVDAAIAQAAHDTLVALYPSQSAIFGAALTADLANVVTRVAAQKTDGIDLGRRAAAAVLAARSNDNIQVGEQIIGVSYFPGTNPGDWNKDPIAQHAVALGALSGSTKPFVIRSGAQFRVPAPPALSSTTYASAFNEVKTVGAKGDATSPTTRTADQTIAGGFWGYEGTPKLGTPARLYTQVAIQVAEQMGTYNTNDLARLLAMASAAMYDAGIATWESKYAYKHWRPIQAVRAADLDGNAATAVQANWEPMGAVASNTTGPNFTPPFPAYPSGHAVFGAALFQTLRNVYGTDDVEFSLVSDEYNGVTKDNQGNIRPALVRTYNSFTEAENENGQSRVYIGVHWQYDISSAHTQGHQVADYVYRRAFRRTELR